MKPVVQTLVFQDEITLFWDKAWGMPESVFYRVVFNGEVKTTKTTHYTFCNLAPQTAHDVEIVRVDESGETTLFSQRIVTKAEKRTIDVTKPPYNAVGDGKTMNTCAIQKALNDCTADARVYFPAGEYLTGALDVHSDTEIYVSKNAFIKGSERPEAYLPKIKSRFEGTETTCYRSLFNIGTPERNEGYLHKNILFRGSGTIYGGGYALAMNTIEQEKIRLKEYLEQNADYVKTCESVNTIPGRARGRLLNVNNAENVIISGLTLGYAPSWNVHFVYCKNVITYGCTIQSKPLYDENGNLIMKNVWNGDGWDPDSSEDCVIFDSVLDTYDDGIAIKSGKNPEGNIINRPTKNVRIFDCRSTYRGMAIGSELSGGIENVYIWDCVLQDKNASSGLTVKTTRKRGGYVKNVRVQNCKFVFLRIWSGYRCNDDGESSGKLTELNGFHFENLTLSGGIHVASDGSTWRYDPLMLMGIKENPIRNLHLKNIVVLPYQDTSIRDIETSETPNAFDTGTYKGVAMQLLSEGNAQKFTVQYVKNLTMENVIFQDEER